jgi:aspartate/methionine/tyrosine aminotransferase
MVLISIVCAQGEAAAGGATKYTAVAGDAGLRKAIADDYNARKKTAFTPEQIVVRAVLTVYK